MELAGMTSKGQKKVRSMVNTVFNYGLEEKLISKPMSSPVAALIFNNDAEKVPEILTGMRNGELHALEWSDIDFENPLIRVSKSINNNNPYLQTLYSLRA